MENNKQNHCNEKRPFTGRVWCDDRTDIYIGKCEDLKKVAEQDHPKSHAFMGSGDCCDYIYFVCWSNHDGGNGFLAEIQGDNKTMTGDNSKWEVFPTGVSSYAVPGPRPPQKVVEEQLKKAHCCGWRPVFTGPNNDESSKDIFGNTYIDYTNHIDRNAKFIWYNSGSHAGTTYPSGKIPFLGHNHDEFLIFRLPVKSMFKERCGRCECEQCECNDHDCNCGCDGCNDRAKKQDAMLSKKAMSKSKYIAGGLNGNNCSVPYNKKECENVKLPSIEPCFYLHLYDGPSDQIETHDTEVVYLTVCNPFGNLNMRGLRITEVEILPTPQIHNGEESVRLVPDTFIQFDCLDACTCKSRELALITREALPAQYTINVKYCIDEVNLAGEYKGKNYFQFPIVKS